ncbi:MAG: zinc-dependent alcohol dehydrogenase family protein [Candidatus Brockarchaeota archaeon]|nr:zinc-dependent alcohol dehydrogenase family protein [Candidatus Brockarchaeota archaeon]
MKAAVLHGIRDLRVEEVAEPSLLENEVLIEVKAAGICGTDIHFFKGEWAVPTPLIPGHEFSGVVSKVGKGASGVREGWHVVAEPNVVCGSCYFCKTSEKNFFCSNLKATGVDTDGAFAEFVKVPASNVYKIPEAMSFEEAALIEPVACCVRGIDQAGIRLGDFVAIIGSGPIGSILAQLAKMNGARSVLVSDVSDERLERAKSLGADHAVNSSKEDLAEAVGGLTGGVGADVAIEAVGKPETVSQAIAIARKGGRVNIFGVAPQDAVLSVKPFDLYAKELTITTSYRSPFTFQRAVGLASSGRLMLKPLITHVLPLEEISEAFEMVEGRKQGVMKAMVKP